MFHKNQPTGVFQNTLDLFKRFQRIGNGTQITAVSMLASANGSGSSAIGPKTRDAFGAQPSRFLVPHREVHVLGRT